MMSSTPFVFVTPEMDPHRPVLRLYCCKSAMLVRTYPRLSQNRLSSGSLAISVGFSSETISHRSPTGDEPASRARSTPAPACPSRASTPPSLARSERLLECSVAALAGGGFSSSALISVLDGRGGRLLHGGLYLQPAQLADPAEVLLGDAGRREVLLEIDRRDDRRVALAQVYAFGPSSTSEPPRSRHNRHNWTTNRTP